MNKLSELLGSTNTVQKILDERKKARDLASGMSGVQDHLKELGRSFADQYVSSEAVLKQTQTSLHAAAGLSQESLRSLSSEIARLNAGSTNAIEQFLDAEKIARKGVDLSVFKAAELGVLSSTAAQALKDHSNFLRRALSDLEIKVPRLEGIDIGLFKKIRNNLTSAYAGIGENLDSARLGQEIFGISNALARQSLLATSEISGTSFGLDSARAISIKSFGQIAKQIKISRNELMGSNPNWESFLNRIDEYDGSLDLEEKVADIKNLSLQKKTFTDAERLFLKIAIAGFLLAVLVALYGDNWLGRLKSSAPTELIESDCDDQCVIRDGKKWPLLGDPKSEATVIYKLLPGTLVRALHRQGNWQLIEFDTAEQTHLKGWISINALDGLQDRVTTEALRAANETLLQWEKATNIINVSKPESLATKGHIKFFLATISNNNTRQAYAYACNAFFGSMENSGLKLEQIEPLHVAAYIEQLARRRSATTVKQHLSAIRQMFDYLVNEQLVPSNPAVTVKSPKHVVSEGKGPVLTDDGVRRLLAQFDETQLVDVRDRAIIAVMLYGFARVSSVTKMQVRDFDQDGTNAWFMLDEKDSQNRIPAHPQAAEWIAQYIAMAGIGDQSDTSLFRSIRGRNGKLSDRALLRSNVFMMIRRRNCAVGLPLELGCQSIRSAGIANYLKNGGILAHAAQIAGHASPKTTQRYDPRTVLMDTPDVNRMKF